MEASARSDGGIPGNIGRHLVTWFLPFVVIDTNSKTEESTDEQLMNSAPWLHRRFLLNIDHIQHQLRYHRRYVTYLANSPLQKGLCIVPTIFKGDLVQESDALLMVDQRLAALRDRTTAILETVCTHMP